MKTTRKRYTGEFKVKVALEALRDSATFSSASEAAKAAGDTEIEKLHAKIVQLVVERDFLSKGFAR